LSTFTAPRSRGAVSRLAFVVVLCTALATACSGGGKHATATTVPIAADRRADSALARRLALTATALPAGWHAVAAGTSSETAIAHQCAPVAAHLRALETVEHGALPYASSAFAQGTNGLPLIRSRVYVLADHATAQQLFLVMGTSAYATCVARTLGAVTGGNKSVTYATPIVSTQAVAPVGDDATAYRAVVGTTSNGVGLDTRLSVVSILSGRVVTVTLFADTDLLPLAPGTTDKVVRAIAAQDHQTTS
jgi:hypothetical protein